MLPSAMSPDGTTFDQTFRFVTFCWKNAWAARVGRPILPASSVKASIDTQTYCRFSFSRRSSR